MLLLNPTPTTPPVVPPSVTPTIVPPKNRFIYTWTGTDGSVWDLTTGPVQIASGASGFGIPNPTHWWDEAPTVDGAAWQGMRTPGREVFLPIHAKGGDDQIALERAFFASISPRSEGTLRLTAPDGTWREINLRYVEGAIGEYDIDPVILGYAPYPLRFMAADPYWHGDDIVTTFVAGTPAAFFPGPPFTIANPNTLNSARVTNPGDQDAYPVWTVTGPCDSFSIGVGTATVDATVTLAAGETIQIDMSPRALTVLDGTGADRWSVLTDAQFSSIPANATVALTTSVTNAGAGSSVSLAFTPRYSRAW